MLLAAPRSPQSGAPRAGEGCGSPWVGGAQNHRHKPVPLRPVRGFLRGANAARPPPGCHTAAGGGSVPEPPPQTPRAVYWGGGGRASQSHRSVRTHRDGTRGEPTPPPTDGTPPNPRQWVTLYRDADTRVERSGSHPTPPPAVSPPGPMGAVTPPLPAPFVPRPPPPPLPSPRSCQRPTPRAHGGGHGTRRGDAAIGHL